VLLLLIVFLAGMVAGASVSLTVAPEMLMRRITRVGVRGPDATERLVRELGLRPDQEEQVRAVISGHMAAMRKIMSETRPKLTEEMKRMDQEVRVLLDAGQQERWQRCNEQLKRFRPRSSGKHQHKTPSSGQDGTDQPHHPR